MGEIPIIAERSGKFAIGDRVIVLENDFDKVRENSRKSDLAPPPLNLQGCFGKIVCIPHSGYLIEVAVIGSVHGNLASTLKRCWIFLEKELAHID
jgi:hypothetical protein